MRILAWIAFSLAVVGCEAPLNLSGVDQERGRLLHRYDQFQGAADNGMVPVSYTHLRAHETAYTISYCV